MIWDISQILGMYNNTTVALKSDVSKAIYFLSRVIKISGVIWSKLRAFLGARHLIIPTIFLGNMDLIDWLIENPVWVFYEF